MTCKGDSMSKYFLKYDDEKSFKEVTKREWVIAERSAGFRPKCDISDPNNDEILATNGFSNNGGFFYPCVKGKISDSDPNTSRGEI